MGLPMVGSVLSGWVLLVVVGVGGICIVGLVSGLLVGGWLEGQWFNGLGVSLSCTCAAFSLFC